MKNPIERREDRAASPRLRATMLLSLAASLLPAARLAAQANPAPSAPKAGGDRSADLARVGSARSMLEQWVETRKLISAERRDDTLGRQLLLERTEIVTREIEQLRSKIAEAERGVADAEQKLKQLAVEQEQLRKGAAVLTEGIAALEAQCKKLLPRFPEPLRERLQPLSQRLPEDPTATKAQLLERFQNIVLILSDANKWNREVTAASELRKLADGSSAQVTTLYLGLGQAYYSTQKGDVAGFGTFGTEGWMWNPVKDSAPEILKAIAIQKGATAEFVRLPVRMQ
jgi:hypothetical protein